MHIYRVPFKAMASACEIVLAAKDEVAAHALAQPAIDEVLRIESKYSRYRLDSIISRINAAAGEAPVACDDETNALLDFADMLYRISDGLFDITSGVLRQAWDFNRAQLPEADRVQLFCRRIGWARIERDSGAIRLPAPDMELDFGGFGKEYAADRAAAVLADTDVVHGYVNLAGDMRVLGPKPDGQPWMIGIQDPRVRERIIATLPVHSGALATSGDYERFFELDGRRYCHVLDPHTGQPVTHWRSVSVLAPLAIVAGSCTTVAMLKQAEGIAYLESTGFDYLAVDHAGLIHQKNY
jgi:thiamine biosynthesis lipoprotein